MSRVVQHRSAPPGSAALLCADGGAARALGCGAGREGWPGVLTRPHQNCTGARVGRPEGRQEGHGGASLNPLPLARMAWPLSSFSQQRRTDATRVIRRSRRSRVMRSCWQPSTSCDTASSWSSTSPISGDGPGTHTTHHTPYTPRNTPQSQQQMALTTSRTVAAGRAGGPRAAAAGLAGRSRLMRRRRRRSARTCVLRPQFCPCRNTHTHTRTCPLWAAPHHCTGSRSSPPSLSLLPLAFALSPCLFSAVLCMRPLLHLMFLSAPLRCRRVPTALMYSGACAWVQRTGEGAAAGDGEGHGGEAVPEAFIQGGRQEEEDDR